MSLQVEGLEDITRTLDSLGKVGEKIATKSVKTALTQALPDIQNKAPKDSGESAKKLKVTKVKKYRASVWGKLGIDRSNWEQTKGLWFQQYGYHNNGLGGRFNGKKVTKNVGWFDTACNSVEEKVLNTLEKDMLSEIDKVLR